MSILFCLFYFYLCSFYLYLFIILLYRVPCMYIYSLQLFILTIQFAVCSVCCFIYSSFSSSHRFDVFFAHRLLLFASVLSAFISFPFQFYRNLFYTKRRKTLMCLFLFCAVYIISPYNTSRDVDLYNIFK